MADLQEMFRQAWSQALAVGSAAEVEAEKVFGRLADAAGFSPDDVKRHAREFGERLVTQRRELERAIDEAVQRTASRFKVPSQADIEALQRRVDEIAARIEALAKEKPDG